MKKTKIDERIENAVNAFFENEENREHAGLAVVNNDALLQNEEIKSFTGRADWFIKLFKQIFLFLPGALILYFGTLATVYFHSTSGFTLQMLFWLSAGSFMTLAGAGSLKERENLTVPFSIVSFSLLLSVLFSVLPDSIKGDAYFYYSIYLFPIVLITANSAKNLVKDKSVSS